MIARASRSDAVRARVDGVRRTAIGAGPCQRVPATCTRDGRWASPRGDGAVARRMLLLGMATRHRRKANGAEGASSRGSRSMWSGHVTFGLVSIPVGIHAALEASERVSFRQLHRKDMAPIRYKKFCSEEDVEVPTDEIVKGYEVRKGEYAPVEKEELDKVQEEGGEGDRTIEIVQFVDFASLNPLLFEKPYYLVPQGGGAK